MPTPLNRYRILVVEDDKGVARTVWSGLEAHGYQLRAAETGEEGLLILAEYKPHLLILDLNLPGRSGLEILQQLREQGDDTKVLVLTSYNDVEDRIRGLRRGADDYLGKPFSIGELEARVEVLLRRGVSPESSPTLQLADLVLDKVSHSVSRSGQKLPLTQREFELLQYLLEHKGRAVSREMLARDVWRETSRFTPIDGVIDVQMARLRQKIDEPFATRLLQTIRGVGYSLREPEA